jgi:EAL domain-containing protein (putative c-di-GMP-specific phosphodiesterase class I)
MTDQTVAEVPPGGDAVAERVRRALAERAFRIVYQPIVDLADGRAVAVEALSRFTSEPYGPPDTWFADAWQVGMGAELELAAFEAALANLDRIPDTCRVAINLSPSVITHPDLLLHVSAAEAHRVVIELTEHVAVHDYDRVRSAVAMLRVSGARLAVDDMGAGFASFRHIVKLAPDIIKLDRELVQDIDADPVRRSVVTAMVSFADDVGSDIVAEGIETRRELEAVRNLRIRYGQGMLIGKPEPVENLPTALRQGTRPWRRQGIGYNVTAPARCADGRTSAAAAGLAPTSANGGARQPGGEVLGDETLGNETLGNEAVGGTGLGTSWGWPPAHDRLVAASAALARLTEVVSSAELGAEPAEVAVIDQAATAIDRIASRWLADGHQARRRPWG